jgi:ribosomal protein L37AE/L43A
MASFIIFLVVLMFFFFLLFEELSHEEPEKQQEEQPEKQSGDCCYCPVCGGELFKNSKHSIGIWDCKKCMKTFFILQTSAGFLVKEKKKK